MNKHFKEFFVCPRCGGALVDKEDIKGEEAKELNFCRRCGKEIASTLEEALAIEGKRYPCKKS